MEKDSFRRFMIEHTLVRGEWVHLDSTWQDVLRRSDYPEVVRNILGQGLAAVALLSATIKYEGSLIMQIQSSGPVRLLVVQASSSGTLRGLARWDDEQTLPERASMQALFGDSNIVITVQPSDNGKPYQGIVAMQGETLADCLGEYFARSEQLETRMWLETGEGSVAGLLLQKLPGEAEDKDGWERSVMLADTLKPEELLDLDSETL